MGEKRSNKRMKLISFTKSNVYAAITKDKTLSVNQKKLIDQPTFTVFDRKTDKVIGNLVDISINGIMIVSETPITEKTIYQLRMEFIQNIMFDAKCVWFIDIGANYYISGFEFIQIEPKEIEIIKKTINRFLNED